MKPTAAADIAPITELVELPVPQNGISIVIKIRALSIAEVMTAARDLAAMGGSDEAGIPPERMTEFADKMRETARLAIVEPKLNFEPGETSPHWNDLSALNQAALVAAVQKLSGISASPDKEAAQKAARFPAQRKRARRG